ncbi:ABC transporter substrate-binding protein [Comamonas aquatica DA1877]|uniref:ABC transporter substrate-binding protein n=1 Tax=Comamonas aquatica DA1877 TaxID=1457173 RepID=A0A014MIA5_9BURK|nr:ABC transporter substrate-binding protein [Comamonas aquatica DA1877]
MLCASLGLAAVAGAHADTLAKVAQSGQITMAYRESSVPFSYLDKGKPVGMAVDISNAVVEAVKKAMGKSDLKVNWQAVTSQNRIPLLMNGTVDLECGSTTNNTTRAKDVDFAINHFYTGTRLLVKRSAGIKDYADLKGKTVAVTAGTTNLQVLRKANAEHKWELEMVTPKDHADAFLLVQNDRAAAFGMDDILLFGLISNSRSPADYEVVGQALQVEPYACMVRKDDPKFKALVDGVIGNLMKSGQFTQLYDKWFMQPIPPVNAALGLPMSTQLKQNLSDLSDKAAF